jgi:hypothetical protein
VCRVPEQLFEHVVHVLLPVLALQEAAGALLVSYRILHRTAILNILYCRDLSRHHEIVQTVKWSETSQKPVIRLMD